MEDYRQLHKERWLQQQQTAGNSSSSTSESPANNEGSGHAASSHAEVDVAQPSVADPSSAMLSSTPSRSGESAGPASLPDIKRVHILPLGAHPEIEGSGSHLAILAPMLRQIRNEKRPIRAGLFIRPTDPDRTYIVVKCDPERGLLGPDSDYFVDGNPVERLSKVQFICLWDFQTGDSQDTSVLFSQYISPYFKSIAESEDDVAQTVSVGETLDIFGLNFHVLAAEPNPENIGIVDSDTMVFVDWDTTPEFDKIHIVPFQDTLPHAYNYDIFNDYLKPYLSRHKHNRFTVNDHFTYQGVQFKVVCCEPEGPARIGRNSTIYCEGVLHPSLRNLLPPELLEQLSHLPPGLQMLLLNTEALSGGYEERLMEVQEMLANRRGMQGDTIAQVPKFTWTEAPQEGQQSTCMVCLGEFVVGEEARRLPCNHVFHCECIDEWLRRCTDCPICKANVDRAVRNY